MKFKKGDRVVDLSSANFGIGTIGNIEDFNHYYVRFDQQTYKDSECHLRQDRQLEYARLPYTKITEKLHKNNIDKIEDGYIYLKE